MDFDRGYDYPEVRDVIVAFLVCLAILALITPVALGETPPASPAIFCKKLSGSNTMTCRMTHPGLVDSVPWWTLDFGCMKIKVRSRVLDFEYNRFLVSISASYTVRGVRYDQTAEVGG